jgi:hypothetical protein
VSASTAIPSRARRRRVWRIVIAALASTQTACDAHTVVRGRILGADGVPPPRPVITFTGGTVHEAEVNPDGTFAIARTHGGHATLRVAAPEHRDAVTKLGGGKFDCVVRLVPSTAPSGSRSRFDCTRRKE